MVKVTFVSSDGTRRAVDIAEGETAREAALFNDVPGIDGELVGRACGSAENTKSACVRHRGSECRDARPAHSSQKNRMFDPENFANRALQRHYPTLSVPRPIRRNFLNLPPPDTLGYKLGASLCQIGRGSRDEPGHGLTRRFGIPGAYRFEDTA